MKTYQDWQEIATSGEQARMDFILLAINEHKTSTAYKEAMAGEDYYNGMNTTIKAIEKIIYNAKGQAMPDYISANHKIATRFFFRDITQATQVLLGNGVTWQADGTEPLGSDFDKKIAEVARGAMKEGVAFGFWNLDHVEVYKLTEFVPLYDEENGALMAGFRFWQISSDKPLRVTAFETDGYTDYMYKDGTGSVLNEKRPYIEKTISSPADGLQIYDGENYETFPIVPCFANDTKTSELNPIRATIDAYDLINSGYANDIDDANLIYWTITNAGGMDDMDLVAFINKLKKIHAAQTDGDQHIESHSVDVPYQGREAILDRLEKQLYKDAMALNTYDIANGAVTATQIEAAYEPLNQKLDLFEGYITDFIDRLLAIAGITDEAPTYTRSIIVNKNEDIQGLISGAMFLDEDYIMEKIMTMYGDKDRVQDVRDARDTASLARLMGGATLGQNATSGF